VVLIGGRSSGEQIEGTGEDKKNHWKGNIRTKMVDLDPGEAKGLRTKYNAKDGDNAWMGASIRNTKRAKMICKDEQSIETNKG